ncbi:ComF family protein [Corynebacterium lizhenjunii]|uniref:ComF family protein n=1 Tax=Corynebacterium lizhenjunii TaxID=2709394 RepID=A0A7T0KG91_9CORY|nr:ComF family protein [Corynebacterium lizhenjunii]QPK79690.1 ComF family protein [Corynebacterium lizhenjunii]
MVDWANLLRGAGELLLPVSCAGCRAPGQVLCARCQERLRAVPQPIARRSRDIGMPVWGLGPYDAVRRSLVIAMKEYNNLPVRAHIGAVLAAAVSYLQARGELPYHLVLVPAPTRRRSARQRGGDPVLHWCQHAAALLEQVEVAALLELQHGVADQSELGAEQRWFNMRGAVRLRGGAQSLEPWRGRQLVLVDDVVTSGATLAASARCLRGAGGLVRAGITLADA